MPISEDTELLAENPRMTKLKVDKESAFLFRRRRQPDWSDNYLLFRDKVQLNRLTQRQSVNIPLIKSTIKTLLKDVDDPPILYFTNLDNDEQAEVYYNEKWHDNAIKNDLILKDIVDKRQVMLFGRSFKGLNIVDGDVSWEVIPPEDILIDRYVDPSDIDSARFIIHEHIYKPLSSLLTDEKLDKAAVKRLQQFVGTRSGLVKTTENQLDWVEKNKKMAGLGVIDAYTPVLGETYIELNDFFIKEFNKKTGKDEIMYVVTAEDFEVLYEAPLEECIGKTEDHFWQTHYPFSTWGDETERADFWSDGVADTLRTLNKILNAFFSQKVENRTLKSFGMNYYNSNLGEEGFTPQTFEPVAWGWYPVPVPDGQKITDMIMRVDVPDLSDVQQDMDFILQMAQQASAATTFQQGVQQEGKGANQITLGEVQILVKNAQERIKSMAVYYSESWKDFGEKWMKLLEAASDLIDPITINKKGRLTKKNYSKVIAPADWNTKNGYRVEVRMRNDVEAEDADTLQKVQFAKALMPSNSALDGIIKKKALEFSKLSSAEISEVLKEDELITKQMQQQAQMGLGQPGMGQPGQPMQPGVQPQQQPLQQPMMA